MTADRFELFDLDSHLQLSEHQLAEVFGTEASRLPGHCGPAATGRPKQSFDPAKVWQLKGSSAPGASDAAERIAVLGAMGVRRQLVLPRVRVALAAWRQPGPPGAQLAFRHNEFVAEWQSADPDRLWAAGILTMDDPAVSLRLVAEAVKLNLRAMLVPCGTPPAGTSPADPTWEPVWRQLADAGIAVILHAGSESGFVPTQWAPPNGLSFRDDDPSVAAMVDVETVDMFKLLTVHYGPQVFLTSLLLGGTLDRYPDLRLAVVELGAQWVAPFAALLDQRVRSFGLAVDLLPSELLVRQVRFTPFHWEPVEHYLTSDLYPVYTFSTDFPHSEGGQQTFPETDRRLRGTPERRRASYFSEGARLIMPDRPGAVAG